MIYPPQLSGSYQQTDLAVKQQKLGKKRVVNFAYKVPLFILVWFFNMP
jgi:hypothetical protein